MRESGKRDRRTSMEPTRVRMLAMLLMRRRLSREVSISESMPWCSEASTETRAEREGTALGAAGGGESDVCGASWRDMVYHACNGCPEKLALPGEGPPRLRSSNGPVASCGGKQRAAEERRVAGNGVRWRDAPRPIVGQRRWRLSPGLSDILGQKAQREGIDREGGGDRGPTSGRPRVPHPPFSVCTEIAD